MGQALRRGVGEGRGGRGTLSGGRAAGRGRRAGVRSSLRLARICLGALLWPCAPLRAQDRPVRLSEGRFTVVTDEANAALARSLLESALSTDTFPGLARPKSRVTLVIAA